VIKKNSAMENPENQTNFLKISTYLPSEIEIVKKIFKGDFSFEGTTFEKKKFDSNIPYGLKFT
jgi:hypothetical protein